MNKKQLLRSLQDVYARLGPSKNGVGVFAIRSIPKGIDPFKNCDQWGSVIEITPEELESSGTPQAVKSMLKDFCALNGGVYHVPDYGIDAIDKSFFLNHSSHPNMATHDNGETFITARRIRTGEELTSNYDTYNETKHFVRK